MRFNFLRHLSLALILLAPGMVLAETKLQVNSNANQFPYITIKVRAFDSITHKPVAIPQDKFLLSEDLATVTVENFKMLSDHAATKPSVDVMFVFDQTGSMSDEIAALLQKTQKFADAISQSGIDFRLGLVSFSDKTEKQYGYTPNVDEFKKNVSALVADGGDDEPENQLDALMDADKIASRPDVKRIFILVTDASYHFQDAVTNRRPEQVIEALKAHGIQLHTVGPELDSYKNMSKDLAGNFYDKDSDDFSSIVTTIGGNISANYEFSYRSPRLSQDGTRRSVRVALKGESATDAAQYVAPWFVTASSRQDGNKGDESTYAPHKVLDGNSPTAWFPSEIGMSNNEWLHFSLPTPRTIGKISVNAAQGYKFNEKNSVKLSLDGNSTISGVANTDGSTLTFEISKPVPIQQIHLDLNIAGKARFGIADIGIFLTDGSLIPEISMHHITEPQRESAKEMNGRGEKAYHAGKIEESVKLYEAAIATDAEYAQAYSNLGLSYWKLKDYPKSVAANRSAIALGKQQGKPNVMASSYYNIARTFEEQKEYKQALMNFWWANKTTPKPVYENAIQRMNSLIAKDAE